MSAVKERLAEKGLAWPLFTLGRNAVHTTEQFKTKPGSILLATGTAWEGFGRAIRTETATCVVAILDKRAVPGKRYFRDMKTALPEMRITDDLDDVKAFIRSVKGPNYFRENDI